MLYLNIILSIWLFIFDNAHPPKRKLVWSEEFNYTGMPNQKDWVFETGYLRNKEMQYYTKARHENARVENGNLVIEARLDSLAVNGQKMPITSASITTQGKHEWQYGRFEVRAKIPSAVGTWPAIWFLGTNIGKVGWPASGEIDLMEHVGFDPDTLHFNIHTKAYNHSQKTNKGKKVGLKNPEAGFHVYTLDWTKEKMDFLLDGKTVFTFRNEGTGPNTWPYDQPFYLILNLAIGGAWGGQKGVNMQAFPHKFYIDYVRVYQ